MVAFYKSFDFYEIIEDIIDNIDSDKRHHIYNKLENREYNELDIDYRLIAEL
jgi:hypothetical protein